VRENQEPNSNGEPRRRGNMDFKPMNDPNWRQREKYMRPLTEKAKGDARRFDKNKGDYLDNEDPSGGLERKD